MKERIVWLDNIRAIAILGVLLVHSTEYIYRMNLDGLKSLSIQSFLFAEITFTLGRIGVPFFLLLTGYLLLSRSYDERNCFKFWRTKWLALLVTTEIWIVLYTLFKYAFFSKFQNWDSIQLLKSVFFFGDSVMINMWYMPMIIGIYLFLPFMSNALVKADIKLVAMPLIVVSCYAFVPPIVNALAGQSYKLQVDLGYSGGVYGIYLILGCLLKRGLLKSFLKLQYEIEHFLNPLTS